MKRKKQALIKHCLSLYFTLIVNIKTFLFNKKYFSVFTCSLGPVEGFVCVAFTRDNLNCFRELSLKTSFLSGVH